MKRIAVPSDPGIEIASPTVWANRADSAALLATVTPWFLGDFLRSAPSEEARAAWVNSDERVCTKHAAECRFVAEQFPTLAHRAWVLPWSVYAAAAQIPEPARSALLADASARNMPLQDVARTANRHKKKPKR